MPRQKLLLRRLSVNLAEPEYVKLQEYCQRTGRTATDVIRESVRKLKLPVSTTV